MTHRAPLLPLLLLACQSPQAPPRDRALADSSASGTTPVDSGRPLEPPVIGTRPDTGPPAEDLSPPDTGGSGEADVLHNPLAEATADPFLLWRDGWYYLLYSANTRIEMRRAPRLSDLDDPAVAEQRVLYTPPPGTDHSVDLWAPELVEIDGGWWIYYSATDASLFGISLNNRVFALQADGEDPWTAGWTHAGQVQLPDDEWAIHPTVFTHGGRRYLAWSGKRSFLDAESRIFLGELRDPLRVAGPRVELASARAPWEQVITSTLEAPTVWVGETQLTLVYAAGSCLADDRALGALVASADQDLLDPASWARSPEPAMTHNPTANVFGPGQPSFFASPDGSEVWLAYHATPATLQGCSENRAIHAHPVQVNSDGTLSLGQAPGPFTSVEPPSGESP